MTEMTDTVRELCALCNFRVAAPCARVRPEVNAPPLCEAALILKASIEDRRGSTNDIMLLG